MIGMDLPQATMFSDESIYDASLDIQDIPVTKSPIWILGKSYSALYDKDEIRADVKSRLWFTYRKGFPPIGGNGPNSDQGWGCMVRCGQMMLAHAVMLEHLGRDWSWSPDCIDKVYQRILSLFADSRSSPFSIHQIASIGNDTGKKVGSWFGPNTIAQVLRKLALYEKWCSIAIYVALDNIVILEDINEQCIQKCAQCQESHACLSSGQNPTTESYWELHSGSKACACFWKPLLLIIPLRLGLTEVNEIYMKHLMKCFEIPQCCGIIGGKPNHAYWFIGAFDDELVFLDPHFCQAAVSDPKLADSSYHCPFICRMKISNLDPSIALCFFCQTQSELHSLWNTLNETVLSDRKSVMFELLFQRPKAANVVCSTFSTKTKTTAAATALSTSPGDSSSSFDDDFEAWLKDMYKNQ